MRNSYLSIEQNTDTISINQKLHALGERLSTWLMRYRTRIQLAKLDDRMLGDIGISRVDALQESSKPFWKN